LRHAEIRRIAWDRCGILRDGAGLQEACAQLERGRGADAESENMRQAALLIARSALAREESRGAHFRTDFPERRAAFEKHSVVKKGGDVAFR
jgi:L-aspartate oxidase